MKKSEQVARFREFSRFYTNVIGLLNSHLLNSPYTLPEARVLYELAQRPKTSAKMLTDTLTIDKGYLSRILKSFQKKGVIEKKTSSDDARESVLVLTRKGQKDFKLLNRSSEQQVSNVLIAMPAYQRRKLIEHMLSVQSILKQYTQL